MRSVLFSALLALVLASSSRVSADGLRARDTAHIGGMGPWSIGVFDPLTVRLGDAVEVRANHLAFFISPNVVVRTRYLARPFTLTAEYGLSFPTPAMRLARGYLFPTRATSGREIPWMLIPRAGLVATWGETSAHPFTASADVAYRVPLTRDGARPNDEYGELGTLAPIEVLMAPATTGYRVHLGALYDRLLLPWLRARGYADVYVHGSDDGAAVTFRLGAGLDFAVGKASRFVLGGVWWNSDQHARNDAGKAVRSNDFYPAIDFIWAGDGLP